MTMNFIKIFSCLLRYNVNKFFACLNNNYDSSLSKISFHIICIVIDFKIKFVRINGGITKNDTNF